MNDSSAEHWDSSRTVRLVIAMKSVRPHIEIRFVEGAICNE
jgi:hypothetical protein